MTYLAKVKWLAFNLGPIISGFVNLESEPRSLPAQWARSCLFRSHVLSTCNTPEPSGVPLSMTRYNYYLHSANEAQIIIPLVESLTNEEAAKLEFRV